MESTSLNWLRRHLKKVRNSQVSISINSTTELSKRHFFSAVSLTESRALTFQKNCFICFNESPLKITKNAYYLILKTLFVFKIFKFSSWQLGHIEKSALLERQERLCF